MSKMNPTLQAILDFHGDSEEWKAACESGKFYTVATPLFGGGYAIGSTGEDNKEPLPDLYPTLEAANEENQEMIDIYLDDIKNGEREEGDEWDGEVLEVYWDGSTPMIELGMDDSPHFKGDWREMAGIL